MSGDVEAMAGRDVHVVPVNDFREHETSRHCWCKPFEDFNGGGIVIVHHSMDRREHTIEKGVTH